MKPFARLNKFFGKTPVHLALLVMIILWILPTLGVFITSFRTREDVRTTGWWTAFLPSEQEGVEEYATYCVGYKGTHDYLSDCEAGVESTLSIFDCNASDLLSQEGM